MALLAQLHWLRPAIPLQGLFGSMLHGVVLDTSIVASLADKDTQESRSPMSVKVRASGDLKESWDRKFVAGELFVSALRSEKG